MSVNDNIYKGWKAADILRLINTKGIGDRAIKSIIKSTDSYYTFINSQNHILKPFISKFSSNLFEKENELYVDKQLKILADDKIDIIGFWDSRYPKNLSHDSYSPAILFAKGNIDFINQMPSIAIVGTRRNTNYGRTVTEKFATGFAENGIAIISGMAQGIDSIAHKATVQAGGKTVAIVACGLDQIQPSYAQEFAQFLVKSGSCILSAYPPLKKALNQFFVQRNRIISGSTLATLVVESKEKGGSLWTARFAHEQNREVYAVPGKINSDRSIGTHMLIKNQIAQIALSPQQILEDLNIQINLVSKNQNTSNLILSSQENIIFQILEADPKNFDLILEEANRNTQIEVGELYSILLQMELNGYIKQASGNTYQRV